jgi:hypothetical protein
MRLSFMEDDDQIDVSEAIEGWRVEACILSLEGDQAGASLFDRAADLFESIVRSHS